MDDLGDSHLLRVNNLKHLPHKASRQYIDLDGVMVPSSHLMPPESNPFELNAPVRIRPRRQVAARSQRYDEDAAWDPLDVYMTDSDDKNDTTEDESDLEMATLPLSNNSTPNTASLSNTVTENSAQAPISDDESTIRVVPAPASSVKRVPQPYRRCSTDSSSDDAYKETSSESDEDFKIKTKAKRRKSLPKRRRPNRQPLVIQKRHAEAVASAIRDCLDWDVVARKVNEGGKVEGIRNPLKSASGSHDDGRVSKGSWRRGCKRNNDNTHLSSPQNATITAAALKRAWTEDLSKKLIGCYRC